MRGPLKREPLTTNNSYEKTHRAARVQADLGVLGRGKGRARALDHLEGTDVIGLLDSLTSAVQ